MKSADENKKKMLVLCIGNIGRSDDGLGWCFADMVDDLQQEHITLEYRYQLQVEDAMLVSEFPLVVFADATEDILPNGFSFSGCSAATNYFFSSHMQSPENILYLAEKLYDKQPKAYTLAITGENWELGTELSVNATQNLHNAFTHFKNFLHELNDD